MNRTRSRSATLAFLLLTSCSAFDPSTMAPDYVHTALADFKRQQPDWQVKQWNGKSFRPRLAGKGFAIQNVKGWKDHEDPRGVAPLVTQFVRDHVKLLGADGLTPRLVCAGRAGNAWIFTYSWHTAIDAIAVDGKANVAIHRDGTVIMLSSSLPPGYEAVVSQKAGVDSARSFQLVGDLAEVRFAKAQPAAATRVIFWDEASERPGPPRAAWRVRLDRPSNDGTGTYVVDAQDGRILFRERAGRHASSSPLPSGGMPAVVAAPVPQPPAPGAGPLREVIIELWAKVRTGYEATGKVVSERMPGIDITGFGTTDDLGQLTIVAAPGTQLSTSLTGTWCPTFNPQPCWYNKVPDPSEGPVVPWVIGDPSSNTDVPQATVSYWIRRGVEFLLPHLEPPIAAPQLKPADVVPYGAWLGYAAERYSFFGNNRQMYFSGEDGNYRSFAFASLILHELGHAVDRAVDGVYGDDDVTEAFGDIVAMFVLEAPEIGNLFSSIWPGAIRTGANTIRYGTTSHPEFGHLGECLMCFAWHAHQDFAGTGELSQLRSLFLGEAWFSPSSIREFVAGVIAFADDDSDPGNYSATQDRLRTIAGDFGLAEFAR